MSVVLVQEVIHSLVVEVEGIARHRWRAYSVPGRVSTEVYRALAIARRALAKLPILAVVHVVEVEIVPNFRAREPGEGKADARLRRRLPSRTEDRAAKLCDVQLRYPDP